MEEKGTGRGGRGLAQAQSRCIQRGVLCWYCCGGMGMLGGVESRSPCRGLCRHSLQTGSSLQAAPACKTRPPY